MTEAFLPVDILTIKNGVDHDFDIYVRTTNGTLRLISHNDQLFSETMTGHAKKGVIDNLYIRYEEKFKYEAFIQRNLAQMLYNSEAQLEKKAAYTYMVLKTLAGAVFANPERGEILRYKETIYDVVEYFIQEQCDIRKLIALTTTEYSIPNHCVNVGIYSLCLAMKTLKGRQGIDFREIAAGFFLHDIGRITIPEHILNKKEELSYIEWRIMKTHPEKGYRILERAGEISREVECIVLQHHERFDGKGYPKGIGRSEISPYATICSIADVFEALTSFRPYRRQYSTFETLKIMKSEMGMNFEPSIFQEFISLFSTQDSGS